MTHFLGLDLSLTGTGAIVVRDDDVILFEETISTKASDDLMLRCSKIAERVLYLIDTYHPVVVMEDYAISRFGKAVIAGVSLGAIIRYFMRQKGQPYWLVPPMTLKKFVSGQGNAKKDAMLLHVFKKWEYEAPNDNLADAFGLAMMGKYRMFPSYALKYEVEAVAKMLQVTCT